jgi:hypothetical protein
MNFTGGDSAPLVAFCPLIRIGAGIKGGGRQALCPHHASERLPDKGCRSPDALPTLPIAVTARSAFALVIR